MLTRNSEGMTASSITISMSPAHGDLRVGSYCSLSQWQEREQSRRLRSTLLQHSSSCPGYATIKNSCMICFRSSHWTPQDADARISVTSLPETRICADTLSQEAAPRVCRTFHSSQ